MKVAIVATIVIVVCSFVAAANTEKHLKSRSAVHPAHIRSKLVHPLVHNTRSKSLNKRDGSTCYKICTYESGSGGGSSSGGGPGSSGGTGGSGEGGSGSGSGSGESGSGSDSDDSSDESRRLKQNKNRISRSKLRSYHNQHNLKARNHH